MEIKSISLKKSFGNYENISMSATLKENEDETMAALELDKRIDNTIKSVEFKRDLEYRLGQTDDALPF